MREDLNALRAFIYKARSGAVLKYFLVKTIIFTLRVFEFGFYRKVKRQQIRVLLVCCQLNLAAFCIYKLCHYRGTKIVPPS